MSSTAPRALLVDDERSVRILAARALSAQRIICDCAADGDEAATMLDQATYDIVVTDLRMPKRNGHALCQSILERPDRPLLVVFSGLAEPRLIKDLQARGVDAIIQKPIEFGDFGKRIRGMIDQKRGAGENAAEVPVGGVVTDQPIAVDIPSAEPSRLPTVAIFMAQSRRAQELRNGFGTETVMVHVPETTDSLCRLVEEQGIDAIVIDDVRHGFLTGMEILARIQESASPAQAFVIGDPDRYKTDQIRQLNICKFFPADASDADLIQAVRSELINTERAGRIREEARQLVKSFNTPACSPAILITLAQYLGLPPEEIPIHQLSRDIMADPATTAELLRFANGSSTGKRRQTTEVLEALSFLGASRAVSLLLSSGVRNIEGNLLRKLPADLRAWYQQRSILIAAVSAVFAERHFGLPGETAFVLGLFQDMGLLVLAGAYGDRYIRVIEEARNVGPVRLHAVEQHHFHIHHAEVSAALVEIWRLPEKLIRPVRLHHDLNVHVGGPNDPLAFVLPMRIGEAFADLWDNRHPSRRDAITRLLADCQRNDSVNYQESLSEAVRRTAEYADLFRVPLPDEGVALEVCKDVLSGYAGLRANEPELTASTKHE